MTSILPEKWKYIQCKKDSVCLERIYSGNTGKVYGTNKLSNLLNTKKSKSEV